jgi:hypothetical protein
MYRKNTISLNNGPNNCIAYQIYKTDLLKSEFALNYFLADSLLIRER